MIKRDIYFIKDYPGHQQGLGIYTNKSFYCVVPKRVWDNSMPMPMAGVSFRRWRTLRNPLRKTALCKRAVV